MSPRFLEDFVLPSLDSGRFKDRLKWDETEESTFLLLWNHKNGVTWTENDTMVFQEWDKLKGHYKPESENYLQTCKQRFRSALYKLDTFQQLPSQYVNKKVYYRRYRIIAKPKRIPKRRSAEKKKTSVVHKEKQFVPVPYDVSEQSSSSNPASPDASVPSCNCIKRVADTEMGHKGASNVLSMEQFVRCVNLLSENPPKTRVLHDDMGIYGNAQLALVVPQKQFCKSDLQNSADEINPSHVLNEESFDLEQSNVAVYWDVVDLPLNEILTSSMPQSFK